LHLGACQQQKSCAKKDTDGRDGNKPDEDEVQQTTHRTLRSRPAAAALHPI
jgi:hypothetical protein